MTKPAFLRSGATLILLAAAYVAPLAAATTSTATSNVGTPTSTKARKLQNPSALAPTGFLGAGGLTGRCTVHAMHRGSERKGVKATFQAEVIDVVTGATVQSYADVKGRTKKNGEISVDYPVRSTAFGTRTVAFAATVDIGGGKKVTDIKFTCSLSD